MNSSGPIVDTSKLEKKKKEKKICALNTMRHWERLRAKLLGQGGGFTSRNRANDLMFWRAHSSPCTNAYIYA